MTAVLRPRMGELFGRIMSAVLVLGLPLYFSIGASVAEGTPKSTGSIEGHPKKMEEVNQGTLSVPVTRIPEVKGQIMPFLRTLVTNEILAGYANRILWNRVTDKDLQKKLWLLFTKTQKINYEIIGLVLQRPSMDGNNIVLPYHFKTITLQNDYSENAILTYLNLNKAL